MTDELQELAEAVAKAEETYKQAIKFLSDASANLRSLKKMHLEEAAKAAGWEPGILVIGKLKPLERLPRKLWGVCDRKPMRIKGIYMGARDGATLGTDPVVDIRWIGSKGQPRKDGVAHSEIYDWHRVIDVPKED